MNARSFAAVAAALFSATVVAHGQEYQVRGVTLGQDSPGPEVHIHQDGGAPDAGVMEVGPSLGDSATELKLKGSKILLTTKAGAASAKDPAQLIGSCQLPAGGGPVILVFVPEKPGGATCKVVVVDGSKKAFPPGSFKVLNLSSLPVKIELEKKPFAFKPGEIRNIENPPVNDANASGFKGTCESGGQWETFGSGVWPHPGGKRSLQVIVDNPDSKLVDMRGIRDIAPPQ